MKTNELMISDLLKWKEQPGFNDEDRNTVLRVKNILDDAIKIDGQFELYHISLFEPIPLTPEILEKIDLKIGNVTEYLGYDIYSDEEGTFGVSEDREGFVFETYKRWEEKDCDGAPIDWGFYPVNRIKGIRYFHELQHALRLCGINKEIEL